MNHTESSEPEVTLPIFWGEIRKKKSLTLLEAILKNYTRAFPVIKNPYMST